MVRRTEQELAGLERGAYEPLPRCGSAAFWGETVLPVGMKISGGSGRCSGVCCLEPCMIKSAANCFWKSAADYPSRLSRGWVGGWLHHMERLTSL